MIPDNFCQPTTLDMKRLNDKVLELIFEIQETYPGDPELTEVIRDLTRVSKFLLKNELKKFEDEKD